MHFHNLQKLMAGVAIEDIVNHCIGWILWPHFLTEQSKLCHLNVIEFEFFSALNLKRGITLGGDDFTDIPKFGHVTPK